MSAFFHQYVGFSKEITAKIVSEWLDLKNVGRLDRAMCNREIRPQFLNFLKDHCVITNVPETAVVKPILSWLLLRSVRSRDIKAYVKNYWKVGDTLFEDMYNQWFLLSGHELYHLKLVDLKSSMLSSVAHTFVKLQSIALTTCTLSNTLLEIIHANPLNELCIWNCKKVHNNWNTSTLLTTIIKLRLKDNTFTDETLHTLAHMTPSLTSLHISGGQCSSEALLKFSQMCPHVQHLCMLGNKIDVECFNAMMLNFTSIVSMDVQNVCLDSAVRHSHSLAALRLHHNGSKNSNHGMLLLNACTALRVVDLHCDTVDGVNIILNTTNTIVLASLTTLYISAEFDSDTLQTIADKCTSVTHIYIHNCYLFMESMENEEVCSGLQSILVQCTHLQKVNLYGVEHEIELQEYFNTYDRNELFVYDSFVDFDVFTAVV